MRLPRRYTRVLVYVLCVSLPLSLLILYAFDRIYSFVPWVKDAAPVKTIYDWSANLKEWLDGSNLQDLPLNATIVINFGKLGCTHIGRLGEVCHVSHQLYDSQPTNLIPKRRKINKDLLNSRPFHWFGTSEYLFYDTITVSQFLANHFHSQDKESQIHGILDISKDEADRLKRVDDLFLDTSPITLDSLQKSRFLSEINVLFGEDCVDPKPDWTLNKEWYITNRKYPSFITTKRLTSKNEAFDVSFKMNSRGKFKIVQLADLHFSVGKGKCRDEFPIHDSCEADPKTLEFINRVLDREKPHLVVFTGDQIMGNECKQDSETALLKVLEPVITRKIPFAMIWGNHDDEGSLSRWEMSQIVAKLPYSIFRLSQHDTKDSKFGLGNYIQQIFTSENQPAISLYFLDSHKYSSNPKIFPGYDWIKEEQWDYMRNYYETNLKKANEAYGGNHLSMAFFHIPLPEYLHFQSQQEPDKQNLVIGNYKEGITAPKYNSGGLKALHDLKVSAVSVGHDHCNDYCLLEDSISKDEKIWLCYGGGGGEGGYAGYGGTERRIRIFEIDTQGNSIYTWKRLNGTPDEIFDHQTIVSDGVPNTA